MYTVAKNCNLGIKTEPVTAGADATVNYVRACLASETDIFVQKPDIQYNTYIQIYSTIPTYIQMHSLYIAATGTVLDYFWDSVCRMLQLMTQIFFFFRYDLFSKYFKIS